MKYSILTLRVFYVKEGKEKKREEKREEKRRGKLLMRYGEIVRIRSV